MTLREAAKALLKYFESGNDIPVERATIRADCPEVLALRTALEADTVEVPREPSDRMVRAAGKAISPYMCEPLHNLPVARKACRAMLAAAAREREGS